MINFRYHIVSLTAVFLALAVGIAMGTTFLNKATVDQLKHQIHSAESGIDKTSKTNQALSDQLAQYQAADTAMTKDGLAQMGPVLTDLPMLVVAADGVDTDSLDNLRTALVDAGADLRGTLTLQSTLAADAGTDDDLASALDLPPGTDRTRSQERVATTFAAALQSAANRKATSKAPAPASIQRLIAGGFLRYQAPDDAAGDLDSTSVLAGGGYRYVFVSGSDPKVPDDEFLLPVLRDLAKQGPTPVVLASAATGSDPETTRTLVVGPVRNDKVLSADVSTVDDLEHSWGLVAAVLAVRDLGDGKVGHYGSGDGARTLLPSSS